MIMLVILGKHLGCGGQKKDRKRLLDTRLGWVHLNKKNSPSTDNLNM